MTLENTQTISMDQLENVAGGGYFHHPDHGRMTLPPMRPIIPISPISPIHPIHPSFPIRPLKPAPNPYADNQSSVENTKDRPRELPIPEYTVQ